MTPSDLKIFLKDHDLTETTFAKVIGVTRGAVNYWLSGERSIPGPVMKYILLFDDYPQLIEIVKNYGCER